MSLDKSQQEAAEYINGHSVIIAGAGSGKTSTLLEKINYLIENNYASEKEILTLSFTNKTVNEFKKRCKYNIDVFTFHKLSLSICQSIQNCEIIEDTLLEDIINEILMNIPEKLKRKLYTCFKNNFFDYYTISRYSQKIESKLFYMPLNVIRSICKIIKSNNLDINLLLANNFNKYEQLILYVSNLILKKYQMILCENNFLDFDDAIINATTYLKSNMFKSSYKYIIVDEYQDISKIRLDLLLALIENNNSTICVVGDDWQSIYGFTGSNIQLFYDYKIYFENVKTFYLKNSYRCPQLILEKSKKFIEKNNLQIKKDISAFSTKRGTIKKIYYGNKRSVFLRLIKSLNAKNVNVLVLSRNNYDIYSYLSKSLQYDNERFVLENRIISNISYMTIHKSKGLESDVVVILNLSNDVNGLPSKKNLDIIDKIKKNGESMKHAEERRLFYVAITRTKSDVYLLVNRNNPSIFVKEV